MDKKHGLVTGSFDPITVGHIDIIVRAAKIFEKVTVVIANNEEKTYMFSSEERAIIATAAVSDIPNVDVKICSGYVADFAKANNADAFVRGIRGGADVAYEQNMADINFANSGVDTVLLFAKPEFHNISSTLVRKRIKNGESLEGLMTGSAIDKAFNILDARK